MKSKILCLMLLCGSQSVLAESESKSDFAIGLGAGTTGAAISATYKLSDNFNLRGIYANYDFDDQRNESGINYNVDIELDTFSLLVDYHPFASSGFRLSLGAVKNGTTFSAASTQTAGTVTVGSTTYNASDIGTLNASVSYKDYAPYLGIGWGNAVLNNRNLSFAIDLGVIGMDNPDVRLTSSGADPSVQASLNAELANERRELESSLDDFDLYPVISLSLNYQF